MKERAWIPDFSGMTGKEVGMTLAFLMVFFDKGVNIC